MHDDDLHSGPDRDCGEVDTRIPELVNEVQDIRYYLDGLKRVVKEQYLEITTMRKVCELSDLYDQQCRRHSEMEYHGVHITAQDEQSALCRDTQRKLRTALAKYKRLKENA